MYGWTSPVCLFWRPVHPLHPPLSIPGYRQRALDVPTHISPDSVSVGRRRVAALLRLMEVLQEWLQGFTRLFVHEIEDAVQALCDQNGHTRMAIAQRFDDLCLVHLHHSVQTPLPR